MQRAKLDTRRANDAPRQADVRFLGGLVGIGVGSENCDAKLARESVRMRHGLYRILFSLFLYTALYAAPPLCRTEAHASEVIWYSAFQSCCLVLTSIASISAGSSGLVVVNLVGAFHHSSKSTAPLPPPPLDFAADDPPDDGCDPGPLCTTLPCLLSSSD